MKNSLGLLVFQIQTLTNRAFLGRLDVSLLSVMSNVVFPMWTMMAMLNALSTGATILMSQALGSGDVRRARAIAGTASHCKRCGHSGTHASVWCMASPGRATSSGNAFAPTAIPLRSPVRRWTPRSCSMEATRSKEPRRPRAPCSRVPSVPPRSSTGRTSWPFRAWDAARQAGFSVPGDVSVVGFDDLPLSALVYPQLSSISQPKYEAGVAMTARLIDRIEGKLDGPSERVISPTTFIARASVVVMCEKG
jgi:hypothetical protein